MATREFRRLRDQLDLDETGKTAGQAIVVAGNGVDYELDTVSGGGGGPTGPAGGVLGGTYPNPVFAADMATQAELDAIAAGAVILAPASSARNRLVPANGDTIGLILKSHPDWQTGAASGDMLDFEDEDGNLIGGFYRNQVTGEFAFFTYADIAQLGSLQLLAGGFYVSVLTGATRNPIWIQTQDGDNLFFVTPSGIMVLAAHAAPADGALAAGELGQWFDQTNGAAKFMLKGKTANGTVVTWTIPSGVVYVVGGTDVAMADGGTGASTAGGALTNLGVSAFIQTLLDDADAATARATQGVIASLFQSGGAQAIKLDDFATPDDNTDLDASTSRHGLLKKLPGGTTTFLRGDGTFAAASAANRRQDHLTALGLITENWDIGAAVNNAAITLGRIDSGGVYLYAGEVITNVVVCVTNAASGAAPTLLKLGLWSSAATPACVAVTADLKSDAMWTSTGFKVAALSSPYTVPSSGIYYAGVLQVGSFGGAALQLIRNQNSLPSIGAIGAFPRRNPSLKGGATDMVVTDTGTYATAGGWWVGVS